MLDWSTTWRFEELPIIVQDKPVGSFSGEAELALDWHGEFYVSHIVLDDGGAVIDRRGRTTHGFLDPFEAGLFDRLSKTILNSRAAQEFWSEQYSMAREQMREREVA